MATTPLQPPPTMGDGQQPGPSQAPPPAPAAAAPAPPKPSPTMQQDTQKAIEIVHYLRSIAQSYPASAPHVQRINAEMREILRIVMEHQQTAEPAAPPVAA